MAEITRILAANIRRQFFFVITITVLSSAEPHVLAGSNQAPEELWCSIGHARCPDIWLLTPRASAEESTITASTRCLVQNFQRICCSQRVNATSQYNDSGSSRC